MAAENRNAMTKMRQSDDNRWIPMISVASKTGKEVAPDVFYYTNQIVNVIMIGQPGGGNWILIDTGMPQCAEEIMHVAEERFGEGNAPTAIILTHGHFDHVGNVVHLSEAWDVPVFAHTLEYPYLTGEKGYPAPDTSVEGGLLVKLSALYPHEAIDISKRLLPLPDGGAVPFLDEWRWVHVPGHSPGQIALFRERDRLLLSADAFVTVRQDALYKVLVQKEEVHGPPRYLITDWTQARESLRRLCDLMPATVIAGHGQYMEGEALQQGLDELLQNFDELAKPDHGRFVD